MELSSIPLEHDILGKFCPGRQFTVQFDGLFGDQPLLEINTTLTTGDGLEAIVTEVGLQL